MKIGILTQPLHNNYGGLLQNYALQTVLKRMGHEVWTIDREKEIPLYRKVASMAKRSLTKPLNPKQKIRTWQTKKEKAIIGQHTQQFVKKNIKTTNKITSSKGMRSLLEYDIDAYIVGSDQVWRPKYSPCLSNYFLDFVEHDHDVKKIAYAASFGVNDWELTPEQTRMATALIKQFDAVSVRENSAVKICKQYLGIDAVHVLDPTMLLNKEDYIVLSDMGNMPEDNKGLFVYILDRTKEKEEITDKIIKNKHLTPFEIIPDKTFLEMESKKEIKECIFSPVEQWLRAFIDAEFVVTDSFHGTVFSIIHNKPFITIGNINRGMARFESLLNMFGLNERFILNYSTTKIERIISQEIDWKNVNCIIKNNQKKAIDYLNNHLH